MAYTLFEKTEIASYTDISALLSVIDGNSTYDALWKYSIYGKLCWDKKTSTLYHCGKYDSLSYKEYEDGKRIELKKLPCDTGYDVLRRCIDEGYLILLPINTQTLGYTQTPYRHNVFITGYDADDFIVYDYWMPTFNWKYERVECTKLIRSIDFTNPETVRQVYVFKKNPDYTDVSGEMRLAKIEDLFETLPNVNSQYDYNKKCYGVAVYKAIADRIEQLEVFELTDCQNFHVILDHLRFVRNTISKVITNNEIVAKVLGEYDELIHIANGMRNTAYKYYIANRDINKKKDYFINELKMLADNER